MQNDMFRTYRSNVNPSSIKYLPKCNIEFPPKGHHQKAITKFVPYVAVSLYLRDGRELQFNYEALFTINHGTDELFADIYE